MRALAAVALLLPAAAAAAGDLTAMRIYPAPEYTRLVIEGSEIPPHRLSRLAQPPRLVLDIESSQGDELAKLISEASMEAVPSILSVRAGRNNPERIRIVFDLATPVSHSLFTLEPVAGYGSRLVLDIATDGDALLLRDLGFHSARSAQPSSVPPPTKGLSVDRLRVVIDAGHGGEDPGAIAANGANEKDIVLDISQRLYDKLELMDGIDPFLSRDSDIFLPLPTRVRRAHAARADLFISIHADSAPNKKAKGAAVFTLSERGASSRFARELAQQANLSDVVGGVNLDIPEHNRILEEAFRGLGREGKERSSLDFASDAIEQLEQLNGRHGDGLHSAGFAVLKSPQVPSVLVEVGFLSNPEEAAQLSTSAYRDKISARLARAIQLYYGRHRT